MTDSTAAAHARAAYRTFEPFHISAYFNPALGSAAQDRSITVVWKRRSTA
ncbi:hypothetical protein HQ303_20960, partial [Rhodococcus sp. BP-110]|nr:hypothetical protein [Rhodococcus sp. BP-110]